MEPGYTFRPRRRILKELARTGASYYFMIAFSLTFIFMYIVLASAVRIVHPSDR